jgi:hypothetical protein
MSRWYVPPDRAFAIQDDEQYRPVRTIGGQHVRVRDGDGTGLLMCHMSRPPGTPYGEAERLVIVVHGALRDADSYLGHATVAAALAGSPALIVAPQFLADVDASGGIPAEALYWGIEGWKGGRPALGPAPVSSFAAMDGLLEQLTGPDVLVPGRHLAVVIAGNSAGGQFVNRYAAVGRGPDALAERGIAVRFIIANPSTYLYFAPERPVAVPDDGYVNRWRYGFGAPPPYVQGGPDQSLRRYLSRDVAIVLGRQDSDGAALLLEVSPPAMAQGANRFERGVNYDAHVRGLARAAGLTAGHRLIQLDGVGHSARDVLTAAPTRELMFG